MIKYRMIDNNQFCKTFYKIDGTKFWYWSNNEWRIGSTEWTAADTKITKPISKSELFLRLL